MVKTGPAGVAASSENGAAPSRAFSLPARGRERNRRVLDPARPSRLPSGDDGRQSGAAAAVGIPGELMDRRDLPFPGIDGKKMAEKTLVLTQGIRACGRRQRAGQDLQGLYSGQDYSPGDVMIAEVGPHRYRHGNGYRFDGPGKVFHN